MAVKFATRFKESLDSNNNSKAKPICGVPMHSPSASRNDGSKASAHARHADCLASFTYESLPIAAAAHGRFLLAAHRRDKEMSRNGNQFAGARRSQSGPAYRRMSTSYRKGLSTHLDEILDTADQEQNGSLTDEQRETFDALEVREKEVSAELERRAADAERRARQEARNAKLKESAGRRAPPSTAAPPIKTKVWKRNETLPSGKPPLRRITVWANHNRIPLRVSCGWGTTISAGSPSAA